jgi:hypothetical protein
MSNPDVPSLSQAQPGLRAARHKFTPQEDVLLRQAVESRRLNNWAEVARRLPNRTARQCRDRYNNYLSTERLHRPWTFAEDLSIIKIYNAWGPKWSIIATYLPGRTSVEVKNRWHRHIALRPKPQRTFTSDAQRLEQQERRRKGQMTAQSEGSDCAEGESSFMRWGEGIESQFEREAWPF